MNRTKSLLFVCFFLCLVGILLSAVMSSSSALFTQCFFTQIISCFSAFTKWNVISYGGLKVLPHLQSKLGFGDVCRSVKHYAHENILTGFPLGG